MAVPVKNFICKNWNCYFDLHNPENFDNPEGVKEWHNNSKCYDYYEKPYWDPLILNIWSDVEDEDFSALQNVIENAAAYEEKILNFFINYIFGDGGAYAAGVHFDYALKTIQCDQKQQWTREEFLMRCLCVNAVSILPDPHALLVRFQCAWDIEHGVGVRIGMGNVSLAGDDW